MSPEYSLQGNASTETGQGGGPVSYASVSQLNGLLSQLEDASKATQADLAKSRIERWKTDGSTKKHALANVDSIQRNLLLKVAYQHNHRDGGGIPVDAFPLRQIEHVGAAQLVFWF